MDLFIVSKSKLSITSIMGQVFKITKSGIRVISTAFLALILLFLGTPGILIVFGPSTIIRWIVFHIAKRYKPKLGKMLSSPSALHAQDDTNSTMIAAFHVEGTPSLDHILAETKLKLLDQKSPSTGELLYPELQQNITSWMGFQFWIPVQNFRIENHVYDYKAKGSSYPNPINTLNTDGADGDELITKFLNKPWPKDRALWEMMLVPKVRTRSSPVGVEYGVLLLRFHHALSDTSSLLFLFDNVNSPRLQDVMPEKYDKNVGLEVSKFRNVLNAILLPFKIAYDFADGLLRLKVISDPLMSKGVKVNGDISLSASELHPISEIKAVAARHGVSFTAILIAMITRGLRETMVKRFGKVDRDISLHYTVPLPNHSQKLRNHATLGFVALPLLEEHPLKRLAMIHREFERVRGSFFPRIMYLISTLFGCQFPLIMKHLLHQAKKESAVVLTNFAWSPVPVKVYGYSLKEPFGVIGVGGTRVLMFGYVSTGGFGKFWVNADTSLLDSRQAANEMMTACMNELKVLKELNYDSEGATV